MAAPTLITNNTILKCASALCICIINGNLANKLTNLTDAVHIDRMIYKQKLYLSKRFLQIRQRQSGVLNSGSLAKMSQSSLLPSCVLICQGRLGDNWTPWVEP